MFRMFVSRQTAHEVNDAKVTGINSVTTGGKKHTGWIARPFARNESNQVGTKRKKIVPYDKLLEQSLRDIEDWDNMECSIYEGKPVGKYFLRSKIRKTTVRSRIVPSS